MDLPAPAVPLPLEPAAIPETTAAPLSLITPPVAGTPELRTQVFRLRHISRAVAEPIVRTIYEHGAFGGVGITLGAGEKVHIHAVTRDRKIAGHVQDFTLPPGGELLLPR